MTVKSVWPVLNAVWVAAVLTMTGCDKVSDDPKLRTFHPHSEQWQQEVEASYNKLSQQEQQLLERYIQRVNNNEAVQKGASETISIADAIMHQQSFERTQQNSDAQANQLTATDSYPLAMEVLSIQLNENREFKKLPLRIELTNNGNQVLTSFKGTVLLNVATIDTPKPVVIPLTRFETPLNQGDRTVIKVDTSFSNDNLIQALQHPQDISVTISKGTLVRQNGSPVVINLTETQAN